MIFCFSSSLLPRVACITSTHSSPTVSHRHQSTDTIPPPQVDGIAKSYPVHIQNIVDQISKLNLLEVADLNELLKVSAA